MNASLSDGNEPVIDIFILSANSLLSAQLEKQLREEGYYVTLFSDGTHLLETLRNGKPNLLMCDTTSEDVDAFEVCRQIKADEYLWNIPVLILTAAADLGDLLRVLDCNADNFIAYPFDQPYLLSLIEGMLTVPVERQTPEQIKTQFKIKHDDLVYVVTADRRKLLEFLLSSFEIAVNKSADLSRALEDIQNLGTTIRQLEDHVAENTKVISILNENLKTREQKLSELNRQLSEREQTIQEKIGAMDLLSRELSQEKSAAEEARNETKRTEKERDESLAAHRSTIDQLQRQVYDLSAELSTLKHALSGANEALAAETERVKKTAEDLRVTTVQKADAEKTLLALTAENEQLKIDLGSEKNRAQGAEQELNAVLLAKNQSEQDMTQIISELKATATDQAAALVRVREETESEIVRIREESAAEQARLKEELDSEHLKLRYSEENLQALTTVREQLETDLHASIDARNKETAVMQSRLDAATEELGEKGEEIRRLTGELASVGAAKQTLEQDLAVAGRSLEEARSGLAGRDQEIAGLEDKLGTALTALNERESIIKTLSSELAAVRSDQEISERNLTSVTQGLSETKALLETHRQDSLTVQGRIDTLSAQLEEREQAILRMTSELETARASQHSAEQELASANHALSEARTSLEAGTREAASQKQDITRILAEKEKAEALAESLSTALKEFRDQLEQEKYRFRDTESRMNALILQRDRELGELRRVQEDARTTASSHKGILEQLRRNLDAAVSSRAELQDKLDLAEENIRRINQDLENATRARDGDRSQISTLSDELERVKTSLEQEILRRKEYEDQLKDALIQQQQLEQDLDRVVSESKLLHTDLTAERRLHEDAKKKHAALEEQVSSLSREKLEAEKTASALSAEINQARAALADEWEDHMTDHERLLAAVEKKAAHPAAAPISNVKKEAEIIKKRSLVVKVPGFSPETGTSSRPEIIPEHAKVPESVDQEIRSVEDLFEDDEGNGEQKPEETSVSIIREPAEGEPVAGSDHAGTGESFFEGEAQAPGLDSGEDAGEEEPVTELGDETTGQHIAFDRTQWLDLLKWSHHCEALTQDQRNHIVRMGRLIQKGRRLTRKQEEQVLEMIALVQKLGYRFS